jgi:hypothetical protein
MFFFITNDRLSQIYATSGRFTDIIKMLRENSSYFGVIPKSRTAKVVRGILDIVARLPDSLGVQVELCRGVVDWCREEKRTFLRQRVEARVSNGSSWDSHSLASYISLCYYSLMNLLMCYANVSSRLCSSSARRPTPPSQ